MTRTETIAKLKTSADALRSMGAESLYLYGSAARGEAGNNRDLDLFIDYDSSSRFNAFDLISIRVMLEKELDLPIDLTTRDSLHPRLKAAIEQSAIRIF